MIRKGCSLLSGLTVCALSGAARATVPPPPDCRDIAVHVMPAPIDANRVAVRWVPASRNYNLVAARLVAGDGTAIALDVSAHLKFGFFLQPQATVTPGAYRIEYSDTCSDAPATRDVVFSTAPPIQETPAPMEISIEPSPCTLPPPPSSGAFPLQTATIPFDDTLTPYLPFLRVIFTTRAGGVTEMLLGETVAPTASPVTFRFLHKCWTGPAVVAQPPVPWGQNELKVTGILANGVLAFEKKATVHFNCDHCIGDGGAADADSVLDGGVDGPRTSVRPMPWSGSTDGCNCSMRARAPSASLSAWLIGFATIAVGSRRKERLRRSSPVR